VTGSPGGGGPSLGGARTGPAPLLALVGPTASGKTEASIPLAERLDAEIVNVDSTLVFRGMDVWTGKASPEQRARVRHHLVDVAEPSGPFSVAEFQRLALGAIAGIEARGRAALLVGGSGLYFRAVADRLEFPRTEPEVRRLLEAEALVLGPQPLHRRLAGLDPVAASRMEPSNARRAVRALEVAAVTGRPFSSFADAWHVFDPGAVVAAGIEMPRPALNRRIEERVGRNFAGLLAETRALLDRGFGPFIVSAHVIGYAEAAACLRGELGEEEAMARIARRDRALARRQMGWFRRDPRIRWFAAGEGGAAEIVDQLGEFLAAPGVREAGTQRPVEV